jgi:hypothetical protein
VDGKFLSIIMKVCRQKKHHNSLCYLLRHNCNLLLQVFALIDSRATELRVHFRKC